MTDDEWLSRNTDGPDNPHSRVYDAAEAQAWALGRLLPERARRALGRRWGWHRIVHAEKN